MAKQCNSLRDQLKKSEHDIEKLERKLTDAECALTERRVLCVAWGDGVVDLYAARGTRTYVVHVPSDFTPRDEPDLAPAIAAMLPRNWREMYPPADTDELAGCLAEVVCVGRCRTVAEWQQSATEKRLMQTLDRLPTTRSAVALTDF